MWKLRARCLHWLTPRWSAQAADAESAARLPAPAFVAPVQVVGVAPPRARQVRSDVAKKYYGVGLDGREMRVASDLDDSIYRYQHLPSDLKSKFDRAAYWMSMASRQWTDSMSASFASLVIAAEALAGDGSKSKVMKKFHDFFEKYAPYPGLKERRGEMYDMRSKIIHGAD
jgi:Apea-like HEPN